MAHVINLQILTRDNDVQRIEEAVQDMLTAAQAPVDMDDQDSQPWLASWSIKDISRANEAVEEALLRNSDELESILEKDFVICYARERTEEAFYSKAYGATSIDLATKFDARCIREAVGLSGAEWLEWKSKTNAYVVQAPYGKCRYNLVAGEESSRSGDDVERSRTVELWAGNDDQALEEVQKSYPGLRIDKVVPA
ncbi:hypothetical protein Y695_00042 [Hydrogenophaga sp. T4]|jgi:hypothetical protein|nr:hypothetical protein Y695_00042 [Hydrogenophaga sp. T4]